MQIYECIKWTYEIWMHAKVLFFKENVFMNA